MHGEKFWAYFFSGLKSIRNFIKFLSGVNIILEIEPSNAIECVKRKFEERERVQANKLYLLYDAKPMKNHATLSE